MDERERTVERTVRVYVPKNLIDEVSSYPDDVMTNFIVNSNVQLVVDELIEQGKIHVGDSIAVAFVPDEDALEGSLERRIKIISVLKGPGGRVVNAKIERRILDIYVDRDN